MKIAKYRIRLQSNQWFVHLYTSGGIWVQTHGPFDRYSLAGEFADEYVGQDWDKAK